MARAADGAGSVWVFDLPGCRAVGPSVDEAKALLPVVVAEHLSWLRGHGEKITDDADFDYVEDVDLRGEFVFKADKAPISADELETAVRHIAYAQRDLVMIAKPLPDAVREWKPPASSVKIDAIFPDVRTMNDMLAHLAVVESNYYLGGLRDGEVQAVSTDAPDAFDLEQSTATRLRELDEDVLSGRVYTRTTPRGESNWSARKVIRRIVAHKRFHTREIEQRLCWLTLGVPEILPVNRE